MVLSTSRKTFFYFNLIETGNAQMFSDNFNFTNNESNDSLSLQNQTDWSCLTIWYERGKNPYRRWARNYQAGEFRIKQEIKSDGRDAMLLTLLYLDLYWLEDYIILYHLTRAGDLETKQN